MTGRETIARSGLTGLTSGDRRPPFGAGLSSRTLVGVDEGRAQAAPLFTSGVFAFLAFGPASP